MKAFRSLGLFSILLSLMLNLYRPTQSFADTRLSVNKSQPIPIYLLSDSWSEDELKGLFALDQGEDLAENPLGIEAFLEYLFHGQATFGISPVSNQNAPARGHQKLIIDYRDLERISANSQTLRSVKFCEIRFTSVSEIRQFIEDPSALGHLQNLNIVFLRSPLGLSLSELVPILGEIRWPDYNVFFSIDSSN